MLYFSLIDLRSYGQPLCLFELKLPRIKKSTNFTFFNQTTSTGKPDKCSAKDK